MTLRQLAVDHDAIKRAQIGQSQTIRAFYFCFNRVFIDNLELIRAGPAPGLNLCRSKGTRGNMPIKRPFHIFGRDRRSIMKARIALQMKGEGHAIGAGHHTFGQFAGDGIRIKNPAAA